MVTIKIHRNYHHQGLRGTLVVERILTALFGIVEVPDSLKALADNPMYIGRIPGKYHHLCRKTKHDPSPGDDITLILDEVEELALPLEVTGSQSFQIIKQDHGNNRFTYTYVVDGEELGNVRTLGGAVVYHDRWIWEFARNEGYPTVDAFVAAYPKSYTYLLVHFGEKWYGNFTKDDDTL